MLYTFLEERKKKSEVLWNYEFNFHFVFSLKNINIYKLFFKQGNCPLKKRKLFVDIYLVIENLTFIS